MNAWKQLGGAEIRIQGSDLIVPCGRVVQGVSAQDRVPGRSMVGSKNGIVAAESPLAAQAFWREAATPWMRRLRARDDESG